MVSVMCDFCGLEIDNISRQDDWVTYGDVNIVYIVVLFTAMV